MNVRELVELIQKVADQDTVVIAPGEDGDYYEVTEVKLWQSIHYANEDGTLVKGISVALF